jgi:hypothetical protein
MFETITLYESRATAGILLLCAMAMCACSEVAAPRIDANGEGDDDGILDPDAPQVVGQPIELTLEAAPGSELVVKIRASFPHPFTTATQYPLLHEQAPGLDGNGRATVNVVLPIAGALRLDVEVDSVLRDSIEIIARLPETPPEMDVEAFQAPDGRFDAGATAVGTTVVIVGGGCSTLFTCFENGGIGSTVLYFDLGDGSFEIGPLVPDDFRSPHFGDFVGGDATSGAGFGWKAVALDGAVHALKGRSHFALDVETGAWNLRTAPPLDVSSAMVASLGETLYLLDESRRLHSYSSATDSWSGGVPWPGAAGGSVLTALDGRLYLLGGGLGEAYDPATGSLSEFPDPPLNRTAFAAAPVGGAICSTGGGVLLVRQSRSFPETYCYTPGDTQWRYVGRAGGHARSAAVGVGDAMVVFGGAEGDGSGANYLYGQPEAWVLRR